MVWMPLLIFGILVLVIAAIFIATRDPNPLGHWRSAEGQQAYVQAYTEAMKLLPPPDRQLDVPTSFGTVRVYEWATDQTRSADPIVLVPGFSSGVPMWESNLPDLIVKHPVYAMDGLGDSGMSTQTAAIRNASDQAAWLDQVFASLGLSHIHLIGHSFGGWWASNYATYYPQRIDSLILLEPVFVFQGIRLEILLQTIPSTIPFLPKRWREKSLQAISGANPAEMDLNNPIVRMISLGSENFVRHIPMPTPFKVEQMNSWNMPVYVAMAANSPLHDSEKAVATAKANVRNVEVKNWSGATHSLPMEYSKEIDAEILRFVEKYQSVP